MLDYMKLFRNQNDGREGQGLVEYALILFLVSIVVIGVLVLLGPQIAGIFNKVNSSLS